MRKRVATIAILLLGLGLSLLPLQPALADTGPKPTMDFTFIQAIPGPQLTITDGTLYECQQSDCSDAQPLKKNMGPQRFRCEASSCNSLAYGYAPYHRIEIAFSDGKTRRSNIFQTAGFDSSYKVTIRPDDLLVEATNIPIPFSGLTLAGAGLLIFCCLGFLLIVAVIIILLLRRRSNK
jgi:hypothetical protein